MRFHAAHRANEPGPVEIPGGVLQHNLAVAHDGDPVAGAQHLAQYVGNQRATQPVGDRAADMGEQLSGRMFVQRRGRFVENDQSRGRVGDREGAGDFDHLASADGERLDDVRRRHPMSGENLIERIEDQAAGPTSPSESANRGMEDPGVFRDRQIGTERKLLKHAAYAERLGPHGRPGRLFAAIDEKAARIWPHAAVQHMHEGRLAGPIVTDNADALPGGDLETYAVKGADGAESLFDAVQSDKSRARGLHRTPPFFPRALPRTYFVFALMAAPASAWVYSWVATLPLGIFGSSFSKLSCVKAR